MIVALTMEDGVFHAEHPKRTGPELERALNEHFTLVLREQERALEYEDRGFADPDYVSPEEVRKGLASLGYRFTPIALVEGRY